jgi:integrase
VRNADGSFDFYTKGRVRYHYKDVELFEGEPQFGGRPTLEFIEDPNGNRIEIVYDAQRNAVEAKEVFGGVPARSLVLSYTTIRGEPRLERLTAHGKAAGVPDVHPHAFRHACATHLLQRGAGLRHVQKLLGHQSIDTTAIYTKVQVEHLRRVVERRHPRERLYRRRSARAEHRRKR